METAHGLVQRAEDSSAERDGLGVTFLDAVYKGKARKMVLMDTAHRIVRRPEANLPLRGWLGRRAPGGPRGLRDVAENHEKR